MDDGNAKGGLDANPARERDVFGYSLASRDAHRRFVCETGMRFDYAEWRQVLHTMWGIVAAGLLDGRTFALPHGMASMAVARQPWTERRVNENLSARKGYTVYYPEGTAGRNARYFLRWQKENLPSTKTGRMIRRTWHFKAANSFHKKLSAALRDTGIEYASLGERAMRHDLQQKSARAKAVRMVRERELAEKQERIDHRESIRAVFGI